MIELITRPGPNAMKPTLIDKGFVQKGASSLRIDRAGNRYSIEFKWPITAPDVTRQFTSRMSRAKREGLRIFLPLLVDQGIPGTPVVDGAGQAGTSLVIRGFRAGYVAREGFWFNIVDASGVSYLHSVFATGTADVAGDLTLEIEPPLRKSFADGDTIHFGKPFIEGFINSENFTWAVETNKYTELSVEVEEYR